MDVYSWTHIIINILSILSCLIVFYIGFKIEKTRTVAIKLILLLSFSDMLGNISNFISLIFFNVDTTTAQCKLIMFIRMLGGLTALLWASLISLLSYLTLGKKAGSNRNVLFKRIIIICLTVTIIATSIPLTNISSLEYDVIESYEGPTCTLTTVDDDADNRALVEVLVLRGAPFLLAFIVSLLAYMRSVSYFKELPQQFIQTHNLDGKKLLIYPTAQLLIFAPDLIYLFLFVLLDEMPSFMYRISNLCYNSAGLINFLVYGLQLIRSKKSFNEDEKPTFDQSFDSLNFSIDQSRSTDFGYKFPADKL